jgi:hypothetical protein
MKTASTKYTCMLYVSSSFFAKKTNSTAPLFYTSKLVLNMNSVSPRYSKNYVTLASLASALSNIFPERKVNFQSCFWLLLYQLKCVLFVLNFLTLKASKMV